MRVAFTICSNNYLAQAHILVRSINLESPNVKVIIGLCDDLSDIIDYTSIGDCEFIALKDIPDLDLMELSAKYDIIELNTSIKATLFKHIYSVYTKTTAICYFDPDIKVYSGINFLFDKLETSSILITPHALEPIPLDNLEPREYLFQLYGLFNLGFLGLNMMWSGATKFLDWWEERIIKMATTEVDKGFFQDQRWINFVPIYYEKVEILKHAGCNVAPWNLHERVITKQIDGNSLCVNGESLVFFHFSNYKIEFTDKFSNYYNRYTPSNASSLVLKLYYDYKKELEQLGVQYYRSIVPAYGRPVVSKPLTTAPKKTVKALLKQIIIMVVPPVIAYSANKIRNKIRILQIQDGKSG